MADYKKDLIDRYWNYQVTQNSLRSNYLDGFHEAPKSPPVFKRSEAWRNVLVDPKAKSIEKNRLLALIPDGERHKWFGSMNSSQALAQSVLGNLAIHDQLEFLSDLKSYEGHPLFGEADLSPQKFSMEHKIDFLGEPHKQTSLDAHFSGDYQIAIECKFTEPEVGTCSRPKLPITASNYKNEYCNGSYSVQKPRKNRCSLTEIDVLYWQYVPSQFNWSNNCDYLLCPLYKNYQLVRNILAVSAYEDGIVSQNKGHVILIYDARNPAFQENGAGFKAYQNTRVALHSPEMLRKFSWQRIIEHVRHHNLLPWLTDELSLKYGF